MIIPRTKYRKIQIGVIGDSSCSTEQANVAYKLGQLLATRNVTVICGGRLGIMEALAKGVSDSNGIIIGILPTINGSDANPYLSVIIPTNMGWTRNSFVSMSSDVIIVLGGKVGTLNEMTFAWMWGKPLISLVDKSFDKNSWGIKLAGEKLDDRRKDVIYKVTTISEAVDLAIDLALNRQEDSLFPEKS